MINRFLKIAKQRIGSLKKINLKKDNRPLIMLICILMASVLWFANSLGKLYETTVSVPVQYTNLPENKVLTESPPSKLEITMEAHGATLLQHRLRMSVTPLNFNFRLFTGNLMNNDIKTEHKILTNNYLTQISRQITGEVEIKNISPDTLIFKFDNIIREKKEVLADFDLEFEQQYFLSGPVEFTPDSVWVEGPKQTLDTIQHLKTRHTRFKNVNSSLNRNVRLREIENVKIETRRVAARLPVSLYTEYIHSISLEKYNVPDSLNLVTFPGSVEISCLVPVDDYSNLTPGQFKIGVDYKHIDYASSMIEIEVHAVPSYIKSFSLKKQHVEFIIEEVIND